jgi:hypothetical protein
LVSAIGDLSPNTVSWVVVAIHHIPLTHFWVIFIPTDDIKKKTCDVTLDIQLKCGHCDDSLLVKAKIA